MKPLNCKAINTYLFVISIVLASCTKKCRDTPTPLSVIGIIHAVPTTEKLSVYIDSAKMTLDEFYYGMKQDYQKTSFGVRKINVTKQDANDSLEEEMVTLEFGTSYSLFVIDKLENVKLLLLEDDLTAPEAGKAKVRFVNLNSDSDPLDLEMVGKTGSLATNKAFKEFSAFETVDVADTATFHVKNTTTGAVLAILADVNIESGKIYTIYATKDLTTNSGLVKGTAKSISLPKGKGLSPEPIVSTGIGTSIFTHK